MKFRNADGKPVLIEMVRAIQSNKDYLSEVDGRIGDGDHGANMNKGFSMFFERIAGEEIGFADGLEELGAVLMNEIGGSMGPIYGTIFTEMADAAQGAEEIDAARFGEMLRAGRDALYEIVDARVGDKTLVDALDPAVAAYDRALEQGADFGAALLAMEGAAARGRDSTRELVAKYGRSARLGERSIGVLDAGSVSCCLLLTAIAEGIRKLLGSEVRA